MKIIKSYISGLKRGAGASRIITIIYGITLLIGLTAAFTFDSVLKGAVGSRPEVNKLLSDFDFTVYSDLMKNYGDLITSIISNFLWLGVFYFLFTIFFAGGVLKYFESTSGRNRGEIFFSGSAKYFFRFLRLGIYTLLIQLLFFSIIAALFGAIFAGLSDTSTEPAYVAVLILWGAVHGLAFIFVSASSDYGKIIIVKEDSKKVLRAFYGGLIFTVKKIFLTLPLYILLLLAPAIIIALYFWFESLIFMKSAVTIMLLLAVQQAVIWGRIFSKVWILGSEYELYKTCLDEKIQPMLTQEILLNENL